MYSLSLRVYLLAIIIFLSHHAGAQTANDLKGKYAGDFTIEELLQANYKGINSIGQLKGKIVILEFWTTWCAPCIAQMPYLNELNDKFKNKDVQFISITYESKGLVERFLKRKSINSWVGLDRDTSLFKSMNITSYPKTVVIDKAGVIRRIMMPSELSETVLEKFIAGNFETNNESVLQSPGKSIQQSTNKLPPSTDKPVYIVTIKESAYENMMGGGILGQFNFTGATLRRLISFIYQAPQFIIKGNEAILGKRYDVTAELPGVLNITNEVMKQALQKRLKIKIEEKQDTINYYKLKISSAGLKNVHVSSGIGIGHGSSDNGVIGIYNYSQKFLISVLQNELFVLIEDYTNLQGKSDINLYYEPEKTESIFKALENQLGLILEPAVKTDKVLVVTVIE